jgi:cytochrome c553
MIYKTKTISTLLLASTLAVTVFTGCGDTKHDENQKELSKASNAPKIEIVQNTNAHQIKVKEKDADKSQSKSYYLNYNIKSEYDENAKPANEDASVRVKPRTSIDANMNIRSPYEKIKVSLLVRKLSKKFIVKCSACHNDYANGIIGPSLLDKDADYIFNKIADFKSGKKSNPLMNDLINMMSDEQIKEMANEIYKFNTEIKQMRDR